MTEDLKMKARILGRFGNLYRIVSRQLDRPEQAKAAYQYFVQAHKLAQKLRDSEVEGRILADWSLLYSDRKQLWQAERMMERALSLAPQNAAVNVDYAVHLYRRRSYADMQKYVSKALFLEPANWQALWYRVKLSEIFNNRKAYAETLKEILRHYPWSDLAHRKLAELSAAEQPGPKRMIESR